MKTKTKSPAFPHGKLRTSDLWQSAYVLAQGGELIKVELNEHGQRRATFIFTGPEVDRYGREFRSGQAVCNVTNLRASMIHVKEVMFSRIKG